MTITLPDRRLHRLAELLDDIPGEQKRLSLEKWYSLLGELRSMATALPGSRGLFSSLQMAIRSRHQQKLKLHKGFHDALEDFRWLHRDLGSRPTRLQELVPTSPSLLGAHDASGRGAGGVWFPSSTVSPRAARVRTLGPDGLVRRHRLQSRRPIVWRATIPADVRARLVTFANPTGDVTNSDLELGGSLLQQEAAVQCFDVRERTTKDSTDNLATNAHLGTLDPDTAFLFRRDLGLATADVAAGVVPSRAAAALGHWSTWCTYCSDIGLDPTLEGGQNPIPYLQVFMRRYRLGTVAPSGNPVRSRTVEDAVRGVAQAFTAVGSRDPRLNSSGKIDFRLQRMLSGYKKQDPPPNRVKPIPVPILRHVMTTAINACSGWLLAIADMICLAFFFLLRPGEYTGTKDESHPFTLHDVQLFIGPVRLNCATAPDSTLLAATFGSLTFSNQKNGVRGECIGLAHSGDPFFSPTTISLARRVIHLRSHNAPPTTPLASYFDPASGTFKPIKPADITATLKAACLILGPLYGFLHTDISGRSLRASGTMALLCAQVDSDIIRLIGRWRSDEMLRYLHLQAEPVMRNFSSRMLEHGSFTLHPNSDVPMY